MLIGAQKVISQLKARSLTGLSHFKLKVGFAAPYAIRIHEDLNLNHPNGGQAKYLEEPSRTLRPDMRALIHKKLKQRRSLEDATTAAGKLLLEAAKELVPVATGRLRDSGFIDLV